MYLNARVRAVRGADGLALNSRVDDDVKRYRSKCLSDIARSEYASPVRLRKFEFATRILSRRSVSGIVRRIGAATSINMDRVRLRFNQAVFEPAQPQPIRVLISLPINRPTTRMPQAAPLNEGFTKIA